MGRFLLLIILTAGIARGVSAADLASIRDTLREIDSSLASVRMVYRSGNDLALLSTYLESGPRKGLYWEAPDNVLTGKFFDGEYAYDVVYVGRAEGERTPKSIVKSSDVPGSLVVPLSPFAWSGRNVGLTGQPLWKLLGESARIVETISEGGRSIIVVDLGEIEGLDGNLAHYVVRLASDRDYSPIEIRMEEAGPPAHVRTFTVVSSREVFNPLLGRKVWLPEVMEYDFTNSGGRVELVDVELNPEIPESAFVPESTERTRLVDTTGPKTEIVYDPVVAGEIVPDATRDEVAPVGQGATARPPSSWFGWRFWGAVGIVALVFATGAWWSRSA